MNAYIAALAIGALFAALVNFNQPRALIWILIGAADFIFTYLYGLGALWAFVRDPQHGGIYSLMPHAFVSGVTDALVAILLATYGVRRWERLLRYVFIVSIAINVARLWGSVDRSWHAELLEAANWAALLIVGSSGIARLLDNVLGSAARNNIGGAFHRVRCFFDREKRSESILAQAFRFGQR